MRKPFLATYCTGAAAFLVLSFASPLAGQSEQRQNVPQSMRKQSAKKGVRELFREGESLFEAKKYREATGIFARILVDYPDHEPTLILYAKSAYSLGHLEDAYALFAKVQLSQLDAVTSYEYGYSFYSVKNWAGGLQAFRRVPANHALGDLANYYGAICAMRLRRYGEAETMMEQAAVLPERLAKSRTIYLKHLEQISTMQQKKVLEAERKSELEKLEADLNEGNAGVIAKEKDPKANSGPAAITQEEQKYLGVKKIFHRASVSYDQTTSLASMHGYLNQSASKKTSAFSFATGAMGTFNSGATRLAGYGLQLSLGLTDILSEGREQKFLIYENVDTLQRIQTTDPLISHVKQGKVGAAPWIEFPIFDNKWVSFTPFINFTYPNVERARRSGSRGAIIQLNASESSTDVALTSTYVDILDAKTEPISSSMITEISTSSPLLTGLSLDLGFSYNAFSYLLDNMEGPDSNVGIDGGLSQSLPLGTIVSIEARYYRLSNNISLQSPNYDYMTADGNLIGAVITGQISPVKWIKLRIQQSYEQTRWEKITPENSTNDWELNVGNYYESLSLFAELSRTF